MLKNFLGVSSKSFSKMSKSLVAVAQMTATADKAKNLEICSDLISKAAQANAKVIFLPEACDYIAPDGEAVVSMAEHLDGPLMTEYRCLAKQNDIWVSVGGFHQKIASPQDKAMKIKNTHVLISSHGRIVTTYDKVHLFDVSLPENNVFLRESASCEAGKEIVDPVETPVGKLALGLCYDLRFPEFAQSQVAHGAEVLTYPSAFTVATGMAHWEALLRARAIETQCYVIGAAQTGQHNPKRASYGHAMVVDPWGTVIAQCPQGTGIALAEIDTDYIKSVRKNMPVQDHKRPDIYLDKFLKLDSVPSNDEDFQFGQVTIKGEIVFYKTKYTMAFVNLKCVLPGHVLVSPLRPAIRVENLNAAEVADLFLAVQKVQKVMEKVHNTNSSTICVQDGVDAGQSIRHVHVHVIPRKRGDFENTDDIYGALQKHDKTNDRPNRSNEEMVKECVELRKHFYD